MDNIGPYLTFKELLERLFPSTYVSYKGTLELSNKAGNVFEYISTLTPLTVGDTVCQGEYIQRISNIETSPDKITLDDATNFENGTAYIFRTTETENSLNMFRTLAMQDIDKYTGQWFNKREFLGANKLTFEGSNSYILHFSVPIIEVVSLTLNEDVAAMLPENYRVYNSRTIPDDRKNPRIKLLSTDTSVYQNNLGGFSGKFNKYLRQCIEGSFGFLEADGSTPEAIKWATARLVMTQLQYDPEEAISEKSIKKEKVDIHEVEYFNTNSSTSGGSSSSSLITGDTELDRIIKMYKSPLAIGGTDPLYSTMAKYYG